MWLKINLKNKIKGPVKSQGSGPSMSWAKQPALQLEARCNNPFNDN